MLPGHYGFSPGLDHCLVAEPQGNPIRCPQTTFMVLVIHIHRNRIKEPRGIPDTSGHRPIRKRNGPPDIVTFTVSNSSINRFLPRSKYRTSTRPQSCHQIRRKCFRSLSPTASMPNFNNLPATNLHNSRFSNISTSLLCQIQIPTLKSKWR